MRVLSRQKCVSESVIKKYQGANITTHFFFYYENRKNDNRLNATEWKVKNNITLLFKNNTTLLFKNSLFPKYHTV